MRDKPRLFDAGFTLIELILVLIMIGILSAYALPRFFNQNTFDNRTFVDEAQSMVRYAEKVAIAQNRNVFVVFNANSGALCFDAACNQRVRAPVDREISAACNNDATWMCAALPDNVNIGIAPVIQGFYFNALGRPFNLADVDPTSTFTRLTITLTGGDLIRTIIVEPETGYVHS